MGFHAQAFVDEALREFRASQPLATAFVIQLAERVMVHAQSEMSGGHAGIVTQCGTLPAAAWA
jgi:hypothetical protein